MQNRKGLVALLVVGAVIVGLTALFNYSRAIVVEPPVKFTITTITLAKATASKPYSQQLEADNGVEPYTWSMTPGIDGALPNGLKLLSNGQVSGTVNINVTAGTYSFTAVAKDSTKPTSKTAAKMLKLTVVAPDNLGGNENVYSLLDSSQLPTTGQVGNRWFGIIRLKNPDSRYNYMDIGSASNFTELGLTYTKNEPFLNGNYKRLDIMPNNPAQFALKAGKLDLYIYLKDCGLWDCSTLPGGPAHYTVEFAGSIPNSDLAIDSSGLGVGTAGAPYSGKLSAQNAVNPHWTLGDNNLSDFGLRADPTGAGQTFTITSIDNASAKQGTATGKITLTSQRTKDSGVDNVIGYFTIKINPVGGGGGGTITSPKINSFLVSDKRSITVTEGDSITFKWNVANATDVQIMGRLAPEDQQGQRDICKDKRDSGCKLSGSLTVNISRSSAFTLKAINTDKTSNKSKTSTASVYVIVRPKPVPAKQYGTLVMEGMLDSGSGYKSYSGRVVPAANGNGWKLSKDNKEQEGLGINSVPKVFNRATGKFKLEFVSDNKNFTLFDPLGRKISATFDSITSEPSDGVLGVNKKVTFTINFKTNAAETGVVIQPTNINIITGNTGTFTLKLKDGTNVTNSATWKSSDSSIVSVIGKGEVKAGNTSSNTSNTPVTITGTYNGQSASATVTVINQNQTGGSLKVTVQDSAGASLSDVSLFLDDGAKPTASTYSDGAYKISNLIAGVHSVQAKKTGYANSAKTNVSIKEGKISNLSLKLNKSGSTGGKFGVELKITKVTKYSDGSAKLNFNVQPTGGDNGQLIDYYVWFNCKQNYQGNNLQEAKEKCGGNMMGLNQSSAGQCRINKDTSPKDDGGTCTQIKYTDSVFDPAKFFDAYTKKDQSYIKVIAKRGEELAQAIKLITWSAGTSMLDDSFVAESSDVEEAPAEEQVAEVTPVLDEQEAEAITETPELALMGETVLPNKSVITQTLDTMDSITLPIFYYAQKTFWSVVDTVMRKRPGPCKYHEC